MALQRHTKPKKQTLEVAEGIDLKQFKRFRVNVENRVSEDFANSMYFHMNKEGKYTGIALYKVGSNEWHVCVLGYKGVIQCQTRKQAENNADTLNGFLES